MTQLIPHPSEELQLIKIQKQLISELFEEGRILYRNIPLWCELPFFSARDKKELKELGKSLISVKPLKFEVTEESIRLLIEIKSKMQKEASYTAELPLVRLYKGRAFSEKDFLIINKINQPVRFLKIFRLGILQELSPVTKALSASVWVKLNS